MAALLLLSGLFVLLPTAHAAGETITGATNKTGQTDEYISLGSLQIEVDGNPEVPLTISVPFGELSFTGDTSGLDFASDENGTELIFSGEKDDVNAALSTLRFRTIQAGATAVDIFISGTPGEVYFPDNGHIYEIIEAEEPVTWTEAKALAESHTKYGSTGYLVTVTSEEENDYIGMRLDGDGWMGASDDEDEGDWKWVTGPEAGTSFWSGLADGSAVNGAFSNWSGGEPNDAYYDIGEDCAQFYAGGGWNDLPCDEEDAALSYYVVEYGADGDLPDVVSASLMVTTDFPEGNVVTVANCTDLINLAAGSGIENRHDTITFTDDVDCEGEAITPIYDDRDEYFGDMGFRGTLNGQGYTVSDFIIDEAAMGVGLFGATDGATISNLAIGDASINGDGCVGGLVGNAYATSITNVQVDATVSGYDGIGGIIGCQISEQGNSILSTSEVGGNVNVNGDGEAGGAVGVARADNGYSLTINDVESTTEITNNGWWAHALGGLVGYVRADDRATITIEDNTSQGVTVEDANNVGGLIGYVEADDAGSTVQLESNQVVGETSAESTVGGLAGYIESYSGAAVTITDTHLTENVTGEWGSIGGLVGELYLEGSDSTTKIHIIDSSVGATITGNERVGGLVGASYTDYGEEEFIIEGSHASGAADSFDNGEGIGSSVGGLIGEANGISIAKSYATNTVSGRSSVGGLAGYTYDSTIEQSYATGTVTGEGWGIGGLVGAFEESALKDTYARGSVSGGSDVGGLVGYGYGHITNSYATGLVTGNDNLGGLIGYESGISTDDSFWDAQTSDQVDSAGGTGKTTTELKNIVTFTDTNTDGLDESWNFASTWGIATVVNDGYPCLQWQSELCVGSDDDGDGVTEEIENAAPNGGDANNDGILDSEQANVTSFVNPINGQYVVVAVASACSLSNVTVTREADNTVQDAGYSYHTGFVGFTANCGTPGFTTTASIYQYGVSVDGLVLRKHNPAANAYFTITDAHITTQTIGGQTVTVATYSITDGGLLDIDGEVNGVIVDPVGLATNVVGAPNTGLGGRQKN